MSNAKMIAAFSAADRELIGTFLAAMRARGLETVSLDLADETAAHKRTRQELAHARHEAERQHDMLTRVSGQLGNARKEIEQLANGLAEALAQIGGLQQQLNAMRTPAQPESTP